MTQRPEDEIRIIERPESVSYDDLYALIYRSHSVLREKGLVLNADIASGDDFKEHIGENAVCFVAMSGDTPVGTVSGHMVEKKWRGTRNYKIMYMMHLAVLPEYSGRHLGTELMQHVEAVAVNEDADGVLLSVASKNPAANMYLRRGYSPIDIFRLKKTDDYSIRMIMWLKPGMMSKAEQNLRYRLKKTYVEHKYPLSGGKK